MIGIKMHIAPQRSGFDPHLQTVGADRLEPRDAALISLARGRVTTEAGQIYVRPPRCLASCRLAAVAKPLAHAAPGARAQDAWVQECHVAARHSVWLQTLAFNRVADMNHRFAGKPSHRQKTDPHQRETTAKRSSWRESGRHVSERGNRTSRGRTQTAWPQSYSGSFSGARPSTGSAKWHSNPSPAAFRPWRTAHCRSTLASGVMTPGTGR